MSEMLSAHRTEERLLEIDMSAEIPDGVTASGPAVVIFDCEDRNPYHDCRVAGCEDVTAALVDGAPTMPDATTMQFTKPAAADETGRAGRPPLLPGFLVGFMALVAANSFGIVPPGLAEALSDASRWCLVVAIAALGVKTSLGQLLTLGWAPITMMVAETVFIALLVLGGVMLLG